MYDLIRFLGDEPIPVLVPEQEQARVPAQRK